MFLSCRLSNIFVIGEGNKPLVSLPKGKGVKLSIAGECPASYPDHELVSSVRLTLTSIHYFFSCLQRSETSDDDSELRTTKVVLCFGSDSSRRVFSLVCSSFESKLDSRYGLVGLSHPCSTYHPSGSIRLRPLPYLVWVIAFLFYCISKLFFTVLFNEIHAMTIT